MELSQSFKARAHLLKLLGDQLIGDDRLAVFELVKNAYDADATRVNVSLELERDNPRIIVKDNGCGMSHSTITDKWLEIGTDSKRGKNRTRTANLNRMPLGEKGIGRLAVHKLGTELFLHTRAKDGPEFRIHINWPELIDSSTYLDETLVTIKELKTPKHFRECTGTRIAIYGLHNRDWSKKHTRSLKKLIISLLSPFKEMSGFDVVFRVPGREEQLSDLLDIHDILDRSIWSYEFSINKKGLFKWEYSYKPPSAFKRLKKRTLEGEGALGITDLLDKEDFPRRGKSSGMLSITSEDLKGIGAINGSFDVYFRRREVLNAQGSYQQIVDYLNEQTGVRIYRDGVRVFNYGEPNDDWLGLNAYRINDPSKRIGTNSIIAAIHLDLADSDNLHEKTNREGFDENDSFKRLKGIVLSVVERFLQTHQDDREELDRYIKEGNKAKKPDVTTKFKESIDKVRKEIKKNKLEKKIGGHINSIEMEYLRMREVTMSAGMAGINLAVIFHEVEREIHALHKALQSNENVELLTARSQHLSMLLEGFAPLLKRNQQKSFEISKLVKQVVSLTEHRFKFHGVVLSAPVMTNEEPDFELYGPFGLFQAALNNLLDNSLYWVRWEAEEKVSKVKPAVAIFTLYDWFQEGPALVVADNGTGFKMPAEMAVQPFKTTRAGGMGLGLYYANMVMETIGGRLLIMQPEELELPPQYTGAAVVMLFNKGKR